MLQASNAPLAAAALAMALFGAAAAPPLIALAELAGRLVIESGTLVVEMLTPTPPPAPAPTLDVTVAVELAPTVEVAPAPTWAPPVPLDVVEVDIVVVTRVAGVHVWMASAGLITQAIGGETPLTSD